MLNFFISLLSFFIGAFSSPHFYSSPSFHLVPSVSASTENLSGSIDCNQTKCIALTFDDGPSKYTDSLLNTLKKEGVQVTFFVIGANIEHREKVLKREINEGHQIGNHTRNHKDLSKLTPEERKNEIESTFKKIQEVTGTPSYIIRPPYGRVNEDLLKEQYGEIILWDIDTNDWKNKKVDTIVANALTKVKKGDIILMHDSYQTSIDAVPEVIKKLKKAGFTFVTINELLQTESISLTKKYFHGPN